MSRARDITLTDGPSAGQTIHVHTKRGTNLPVELYVCQPVPADAEPIPGPFHRYQRTSVGYRYAPHQNQREAG